MADIPALIQSNPELAIYIGVGLVATFAILAGLFIYLRKTATRRAIKKTIKDLGGEAIEGLVLRDGMDSYVNIDYCIFTRGYVLALSVQDYPGMLFGGEKIELWTQMYNKNSYKFDNPLHYNQTCVHVLSDYLPDLPVIGQVVFTNNGEFPKGIPASVSMLDKLVENLEKAVPTKNVSERDALVWETFCNSRDDQQRSNKLNLQSS